MRWLRAYGWSLDKVIKAKPIMLAITLLTFVGTGYLYVIVPKGFFPREDTGYMFGVTEAVSDISFPAMVERQRKVAEIIRKDPAVEYVNSTVGVGGPIRPAIRAACWSRSSRRTSATPARVVIGRLRRAGGQVIGMRVFFQSIQNIRIGGRLSKSEYQYTLQSSDTERLYSSAPKLSEKIAQLPGLLDVTTDLYVKNPQMRVEIDREKAAVYGITVDQMRQELFDAFGNRQVATIYTPSNDYQVILEALPEQQESPTDLSRPARQGRRTAR